MTDQNHISSFLHPESLINDLARSFDAVGALIARVRVEQWSAPTPCAQWTVRALVDHLIGMNRVFIALLAGQTPPQHPAAGHVERDPGGAYGDTAAALQTAFAAAGVLEREYRGPLGSATGAKRLQIRLYDLLAHGWDLARATGQLAELPDDVAQRALLSRVFRSVSRRGPVGSAPPTPWTKTLRASSDSSLLGRPNAGAPVNLPVSDRRSTARLRRAVVLRVREDACDVLIGGHPSSVRYAPQLPSPRIERVSPGHLVAVATAPDGTGVVVWRWYDAVVLEEQDQLVRLWEPAHGEVLAQQRSGSGSPGPGTRAYLSAGLPGAEWWVAGPVAAAAEDADVELDEVERLYTEYDLWDDLK